MSKPLLPLCVALSCVWTGACEDSSAAKDDAAEPGPASRPPMQRDAAVVPQFDIGTVPPGAGGGGADPSDVGGAGGGASPVPNPDPEQNCDAWCAQIADCLAPICDGIDRAAIRESCQMGCDPPPSLSNIERMIARGCEATNAEVCDEQPAFADVCDCDDAPPPDATVDVADSGVGAADSGLPPGACDPADDTCEGNTICIDGNCVGAFNRRYEITVGRVTLADDSPDQGCWDPICDWPDPLVVVLIDENEIGRTARAEGTFEADFDTSFDFDLFVESELEVVVYDSDSFDSDDLALVCRGQLTADLMRGRTYGCNGEYATVEGTIWPR